MEFEYDRTRKDGAYISEKLGDLYDFIKSAWEEEHRGEQGGVLWNHPMRRRNDVIEPNPEALRRLSVDTSTMPSWSNSAPAEPEVPVGTIEEYSPEYVKVRQERGWLLVKRSDVPVELLYEQTEPHTGESDTRDAIPGTNSEVTPPQGSDTL